MQMDKIINHNDKKYEIIFKDIYKKIQDGTIKQNGILEPEKILTEKYDVSRLTVRKALAKLNKLGLIYAIPGRGTFIGKKDIEKKEKKVEINILVVSETPEIKLEENSWVLQINRKIDKLISKNGGKMYIYYYTTGNIDKLDFEEIESIIKMNSINGIILVYFGDNLSYTVKDGFRKLTVPVVRIGDCKFPDNINYVTVDGRHGAFSATEHLIKLGHSKIAFVFYSEKVSFSYDRLEGYKDALRIYNIEYKDTNIINVDRVSSKDINFMIQEGYNSAEKILKETDSTAAVTINDFVAVGIIKYINETGRKVPEDFSVVGFDDYYSYRHLNLTTMQLPLEELGEKAVELLINKILKGQTISTSEIIRISPALIVRDTTGYPASRD